MSQSWPAADIARMILDGFDDYREHFRQITDGARPVSYTHLTLPTKA